MNADLIFNRHRPQVIALPQAAIGIGQEFWHQEQGQAFAARRAVGRPGEDQMNDIGAQIMLAIGDEALLPCAQVMIALTHRLGAD